MVFCADKDKKYYLCLKINLMKKLNLFFFGLALLLSACAEKPASLIGEWVADKVNVQFDESRNTPELVKQVGEMEKQNRIRISADSILVFNSLDGEIRGRLTLDNEGAMFCDGTLFGQWKEGQIVTKTDSPLGEIIVWYKKK